MSITPRKQTAIIFAVCAAAVGAAVFYSNSQSAREAKISEGSKLTVDANPISTQPLLAETNWQKAFTDTKSAGFSKPVKAASSTETEKLTPMEKFSRDFFTQYANLKQNNLLDNPEMVDSTIGGLIENYHGETQQKIYSYRDIVVIPDVSKEALRAYGNAVGTIMRTYAPAEDDAALALAGINKVDPNYIQKINSNIVAYDTIISKLLATPAPKSLQEYHLGLINSVSNFRYIASSLTNSDKDPLGALISIQTYSSALPSLAQNFTSIRQRLLSAGISYKSTEGGSFFNLP